jgi:hypothetical protein
MAPAADRAPARDRTKAERRRERRLARERAERRRRRRLELGHDALALGGALAAMAVIAVAFAVWPAISAARGDGTPGTFTIAGQECARRAGCVWVGSFESRTGQVTPHVTYDGNLPASDQPGQQVAAVYPGGDHAVFGPHSAYWAPAIVLMLIVGGAVGFGLWVSPLCEGKRRIRLA